MKALDKKTMEVQELIERGKVLYSLDKYDEALNYFKKAQDIDKYNDTVYENICMCYIMLDHFDDAKKTLNKYLMLNKNSGVAYFHLGNIALLEGKATEAKSLYSKAELLGFDNPVMFVNLASFYEENGEVDKAVVQYNKILRQDPYDYSTLERKAQLLLGAERYAEALQVARTMVQTDIDKFEGHQLVYVNLIMLNRNEEAGIYLDELANRFPEDKTVLFDRARLYDLNGEVDQALKILEENFQNLEENPRTALLKLGLLLQKQETEKVIDLIENSPSLQQEETALTMMYSIYYMKGEYSKAIEYCNKIRDLGEESSQYYATLYFRPLAQRKMGKEKQALQDFEVASKILREVSIERPGQVELNMYRALCEYQLSNFAEARKLIEYLLAVEPNVAEFHFVAAAIYEAMSDMEEAQSHKEHAYRLNPKATAPLA